MLCVVLEIAVDELDRLCGRIAGPEHAWSWSRWRRERQYQARQCHYRKRGYPLT